MLYNILKTILLSVLVLKCVSRNNYNHLGLNRIVKTYNTFMLRWTIHMYIYLCVYIDRGVGCHSLSLARNSVVSSSSPFWSRSFSFSNTQSSNWSRSGIKIYVSWCFYELISLNLCTVTCMTKLRSSFLLSDFEFWFICCRQLIILLRSGC